MFICMPKINAILSFFLEILPFTESCKLIDRQHLEAYIENQNFTRYVIGGETSMTTCLLDYFQETLFTTFFKKSKKLYLGAILGIGQK